MLSLLIAACSAAAFSQERSKFEAAVGFSISSIDTGQQDSGFINAGNRETGYGFDTSLTGYVTDKFGIEGNFDGHYKNKRFTTDPVTCQAIGCPVGSLSIDTNISTYNFMAGPHVRFATSGRVTPFLHALAGANHARVKLNFPTSDLKFKDSQTNFGLKLGGGLDIGMSTRTALRLGFDYNPVFERDDNSAAINGRGRTRNDVMFNVGIVFK